MAGDHGGLRRIRFLMKTCLVIQREIQRDAAVAVAGRVVGPLGDVLTLCLAEPHVLAPTEARTANFFAPPSENGFDCVFVDKVRLFDSLWSEAFIAFLARRLRPNGCLYLQTAGAASNSSLFLAAATVSRVLGSKPEVTDGPFVGWRVRAPPRLPPSSLAWYLEHWLSIIETDLRVRDAAGAELVKALPENFIGLCQRVDLNSQIPISPYLYGRRTGQAADVTQDTALAWALRYYCYAIGGISDKSAACAHIAKALDIPPGSNWIDLGGGFGALSIDLVLDERVRAASSVCVDQFPANLAIAGQLFAHYAELLSGRARFACCAMEDYRPDRAPDIVTAIGSLLYISRDRVGETLDRVWASIAPGGALLIHENILAPSDLPARDTAQMFGEEELTEALSALGEVQCFDRTTLQRLEAPSLRHPYRVVRKPLSARNRKPLRAIDPAENRSPTGDKPFWDAGEWKEVQSQFRSITGPEGARLRWHHYRPFFQRLGRDVLIEEDCWFGKPWRIALDDGCGINRGAIFEGSSAIRIGRHVRIGHNFFVHSANHDTVLDEPAHFERGYVFKPVEIGDNTLISTNVAVMPGAHIGAGSFVAAQSLVPGKSFPDGSYLAGTPARKLRSRVMPEVEQLAAQLVPAPAIGLLVGSRQQAEAAGLMTTALGLPQIVVIEAGQSLSRSLCALVCFDEAAFAGALPEDLDVWRLDGSGEAAAGIWIEDQLGERIRLAAELRREHTFGGFGDAPTLTNVCRATLFWATNASLKGTAEARERARPAWGLTVLTASYGAQPSRQEPRGTSPWDSVFEVIGGPLIDPAVTAGSWRAEAGTVLEQLLEGNLARIGDSAFAAFFAQPQGIAFATHRRVFLNEPHLLPYFVWRWRSEQREMCQKLLSDIAPFLNTSTRKAAAALAYGLLNDFAAADAIFGDLLGSGWIAEGTCLIRVLPDRPSIDRSPPLAALLLDRLFRERADYSPFGKNEAAPLSWHCVARADGDAGAGIDRASVALVCAEQRTLSRSLLDNWLALQAASQINSGALYLADCHYSRDVEAIEAVWRRLFLDILERAGKPLIKPLPWPAGYDFALSLRYDVDRDAGAAQIMKIASLEKKHANAACGSWYFLKGAPHNDHVEHVLNYWNQEYAVHTCLADDAIEGRGVTAHSGPQSRYWYGREYLIALEARAAAYAEAIVTNFSTARPGWLASNGEEPVRCTEIWLTPLHYPLEGGGQTDTSYFDQRLASFRRQIAAGGHVIIGSHPDCDQGVLDAVLSREDLSRAWAVPVRQAVDRVRALRGAEGLELLTDPAEPGSCYLRSARYLADVAVELWRPGQSEPVVEVLQLNASIARRLTSIEPHPVQASPLAAIDRIERATPIPPVATAELAAPKRSAKAVEATDRAPVSGVAGGERSQEDDGLRLDLARGYEAQGDWLAAFGQWRALAPLANDANAAVIAAGTLRAGLRAARQLEGDGQDAKALEVWRAMLHAAPACEPARKGVERLALRLARAAEANSDWAGAAGYWRQLSNGGASVERGRDGLRRCLLRAARAAEAIQQWRLGLAYWQEYAELVPDDERGEKGAARCAAKARIGERMLGSARES